ncbi:MAG: hypothetical protein IJF09_01705 [Ruminiclostridium sp.]|nr:hypothetical protein [Ruminiclostridium sp.]
MNNKSSLYLTEGMQNHILRLNRLVSESGIPKNRVYGILPCTFISNLKKGDASDFLDVIYQYITENTPDVVNFKGDNPVIHITPQYSEKLSALKGTLYDTMSDHAGIGAQFRGIAMVSLDEWAEDCSSANFSEVIDYIVSLFNNSLIFFTCEGCRDSARLIKALSKMIMIEAYDFCDRTETELKGLVNEYMRRFNYDPDEAETDYILDKCRQMLKNNEFSCNSLILTCKKIIYQKLAYLTEKEKSYHEIKQTGEIYI